MAPLDAASTFGEDQGEYRRGFDAKGASTDPRSKQAELRRVDENTAARSRSSTKRGYRRHGQHNEQLQSVENADGRSKYLLTFPFSPFREGWA